MPGPLAGIRVVEIAGIGPVPLCATMLSDMGAEVLRLDRMRQAGGITDPAGSPFDILGRGRRSAAVDLKHADGVALVLRLLERADVLLEGFRPGVMERLGLGPDVVHARNPAVVYGRMTGWGRTGPMAQRAGHDINYIALTGMLDAVGRRGQAPTPPLNAIGDYGGGGMLLGFGVLAALVERQRSGCGQVVDAAMVDGAALLAGPIQGAHQTGFWSERGTNLLDSGAPFYDAYETADGKYVSVGAIEPQFYAALLEKLGLADETLPQQMDRDSWPALKQRFAEIFRTRTRDEWCTVFGDADACFAPVLDFGEAMDHPHAVERSAYAEVGAARHPAPAPRFDRTPGAIAGPPVGPGAHTDEVLADWGVDATEIAALREKGAVA